MTSIKGLIESDLGMPTVGRATTATLFVSPNGDDSDGSTWAKAHNTIQDALDAASTDADDCTLILIGPHATNYDIATADDPTWTGNYILKAVHRSWSKIMNSVGDSVFKFTGKVAIQDLYIDLGTGVNGIILTADGFRVDDCMIYGESLTGAATAIHIDGTTSVANGKIRNCDIKGNTDSDHMTGILLHKPVCTEIEGTKIGYCLSGLQQVGANSALNKCGNVEFCTCAIGVNIDAGTAMSFDDILLYNNDLNFDDVVGGHLFNGIRGEFPITLEPEDLAGITVDSGANTWGGDTEIRAAATATKPFKVIAYQLQPSHDENMIIRFSADSGSTYFCESIFASKKNKAASGGDATDFIFNAGTRISADLYGSANDRDVDVWLEIQEI